MSYDVLGDLVEPVVPRDEVILTRKLAFQLLFLGLIEFSGFEQPLYVLVEVFVCELELGDAVLVVERNRRVVLDRLTKVVDADVISEDLFGLLFADHQRCAREANERCIR